jgi:hypothetical protein
LFRIVIDSFANVQNEGTSVGRLPPGLKDIFSKSEGMCPAIVLDNSDRKVLPLKFWPQLVMMTHRRRTAEEITNPSPPQTCVFRHPMMRCDHIGETLVNILSPFTVVLVVWPSQSWIKSKLEMIMCVHKPRKNEEAT